jgi:alkanesulfonate monooxygenase SsuD/methylene tetrahydromethanopterin reductase-like flavin-dependent oxidoreductase (luciferase family)
MIRDFGRRAEGIGLDSIWMGEHVALFDKNTFGYPGSKDGRIPVPEGGGMLDVTATFGFLAAATSRLRFGTGVALVPQRNPLYTAKEVCTLDWLTEGRVDFGVGVGWNKPVQKPHVPIIVGGYVEAAFRRAARFGAGWYGFNRDPAATREPLDRLDAALAKAGRTRGEGFEVIITPPVSMPVDAMQAYAEVGVDRLVVNLGSQRPERVEHRLAELERLVRAAA